MRKLIRGEIRPERWFEAIVMLADLVAGELALPGLCDDPDDDKYVAAAIEGNAGSLS